jgi:predicted ATPase
VSDAARLFADRASHVQARFELSEDVAGAVETIVRRVDGIPLAIELAAARVRVLSPEEIAGGLDDHLRLLRGLQRRGPGQPQGWAAGCHRRQDHLDANEIPSVGRCV